MVQCLTGTLRGPPDLIRPESVSYLLNLRVKELVHFETMFLIVRVSQVIFTSYFHICHRTTDKTRMKSCRNLNAYMYLIKSSI